MALKSKVGFTYNYLRDMSIHQLLFCKDPIEFEVAFKFPNLNVGNYLVVQQNVRIKCLHVRKKATNLPWTFWKLFNSITG